jgi:hypothetical protein
MLIMDIIGALFKKQPVKEVLLNVRPEGWGLKGGRGPGPGR